MTADAKQVLNIDVPEGGQYSVDFAPDGKSIIAGGFDGTIRIYEVPSGKLLHSFLPIELSKQ